MRITTTLIAICLSILVQAQTINLAGTWQFAIDRNDQGVNEQWYKRTLDDTIELPASMPQRLKGDDISVNTHWVGSLYDSSYFYNPYMAKYRKPGKDMKLTFFLTPDKHYVGVAWYQRTVRLQQYDKNSCYTLYLERPHIETTLFVNGQRVGMRNSLVVAHQYDVTPYLHQGENVISIRIDNRPETVNVGQDSHSITDQTQGDWNGIVGRIELQQTSATHINDLQVYPDIDKQEALVKLQVVGKPKSKYTLTLHAYSNEIEGGYSEGRIETTVTLTSDTTLFEYPVKLKNMKLWDEFHPYTYILTALLSKKKSTVDLTGTTFGMRKFEIRGKMFYVNGHEVQLRGTVENCDFPLTGYAPMDIASWERVFRRCKEYGLNHMRFHSYCPPNAAFAAADKVGFYLQPEGPSWPNHGVALGNGRPIDTYLMEETIRMAKDYGNHPSFCMLACGNEPAGRWVDWVSKFVDYWKATDTRRVYTGASVGGSWQWQPKSQ
ncbi:MAG: beta-glucuronidase, partial [Bacteroidaceae bacterium]|nr:beta-glucuronidase [Bacteroidaceae bacterium]